MRAKEAKTISIADYLATEGFRPAKVRKNGNELWYCSPIRAGDSTPSFKVDVSRNLWYDAGLDIGGTTIDIVMQLRNVSVKESLAILEATGLSTQFFHTPTLVQQTQKMVSAGEKEKSEGGLEIVDIGPIRSPSLLQYLDSRCINHDIAGRFLKEVRYKPRNKVAEFYALGWPSGEGFDIRSSTFKGFAGTGKDITRLGLADGKSLSLFEGFFDFLAFLTYYDISELRNSAIVMNSTALRKRVLEEIQLYDFEKIYLFLDNDRSGEDCRDFFKLACEDIEVVDKSNLYSGYKDFNEMLICKC